MKTITINRIISQVYCFWAEKNVNEDLNLKIEGNIINNLGNDIGNKLTLRHYRSIMVTSPDLVLDSFIKYS